eukprot:659056-Prorocentrum_minimum.AAC.1
MRIYPRFLRLIGPCRHICRHICVFPLFFRGRLKRAAKERRTGGATSALRLVLTLGIHCLPSCDWFSRWVYIASPRAIGSHA